jgi:hypothetical protein
MDPIERPDERVLGDFLGQGVITRQAVSQPINPVHVGIVQLSLRGGVTSSDSVDQLWLVHLSQLFLIG